MFLQVAARTLLLGHLALASLAVEERPSIFTPPCQGKQWQDLFEALTEAAQQPDYFTDRAMQLLHGVGSGWYKDHYLACVEGLFSMILYLSFHSENKAVLLDLAEQTARELNPLALRSGLGSWPTFGLLPELHLAPWQSGDRATPLHTEPWRLSRCPRRPHFIYPWSPEVGEPVLGKPSELTSPLRLLPKLLEPGDILVDAGVFDGTDWSLAGIQAGAVVLGLEPLPRNRELMAERLPAELAKHHVACPAERQHLVLTGEPEDWGKGVQKACWFTSLPVPPGKGSPAMSVFEALGQKGHADTSACRRCAGLCGVGAQAGQGFSVLFGAALGERVRGLNITTRYDYSSITDQGYLLGPADMRSEEVAVTTLEEILKYLQCGKPQVDVLKLDVEGYEMGALRGAERLLAEGQVHWLVLEFHPGMLGTTGTDPLGLLQFLEHYCFKCFSVKIKEPMDPADFVARYTSNTSVLPLQGLGALEDLLCKNMDWAG